VRNQALVVKYSNRNYHEQKRSFNPQNLEDWKLLASSGALALVVAYLYLNDSELVHADQQPSDSLVNIDKLYGSDFLETEAEVHTK
jgi:hypothetical protein